MIPKKNALEWSVFAVSFALIIAAVSVLLIHSSRGADKPPQFVIRVGDAIREQGGYHVPIEVENRGDRTAADLRIEVELVDGGEIREQSEFTLAYIPRRSTREAGVIFAQDPRCCTIIARAVGFESP